MLVPVQLEVSTQIELFLKGTSFRNYKTFFLRICMVQGINTYHLSRSNNVEEYGKPTTMTSYIKSSCILEKKFE